MIKEPVIYGGKPCYTCKYLISPEGSSCKIYKSIISKCDGVQCLLFKQGKILHLNLYRKWFVEIAEGRKKHEFREASPHWVKRLCNPPESIQYILFKNGMNSVKRKAPEMLVRCLGVRYMLEGQNTFEISLGEIIYIKNYKKEVDEIK